MGRHQSGALVTETTDSRHVLVVDDEEPVRKALSRLLQKKGWEVELAGSGAEALERIAEFRPQLMLLDIRMHGMTGIDVVPEALGVDPDLGILMLTAVSDATSAAICMQKGAFDYLTKPIEVNDLESALQRALKRRDNSVQSKGISRWLKEEVTKRTEELQQEQEKLRMVAVATLEALINALEAKNAYFVGHSARIGAFSAMVASGMGMSEDEIEQVRIAGRLHDLGKIGIREDVLNKKGTLTEEEYAHVKKHVTMGADILAPLSYLGPVVDFVATHHEHWDGSGYPRGISGDDIPLGGRIICAGEVYDALTTNRPYQDKLDPEEALDRMRTLEGNVIDPSVTKPEKWALRTVGAWPWL